MEITLLSWNVAARRAALGEQVAAVARREAGIVCLQEVRPSTVDAWRAGSRRSRSTTSLR